MALRAKDDQFVRDDKAQKRAEDIQNNIERRQRAEELMNKKNFAVTKKTKQK